MGHRDRFDPSKMAIESKTMFPNGESDASHAAANATICQLESSIEETPTATDIGRKKKDNYMEIVKVRPKGGEKM